MRLSKTVRGEMALFQNLPKPTALDKEVRRMDRNRRKKDSKRVYKHYQPEKKKSVARVMNVFWFSEVDGVFSVFKAHSEFGKPVRKYKVKELAMKFCKKANSKVM